MAFPGISSLTLRKPSPIHTFREISIISRSHKRAYYSYMYSLIYCKHFGFDLSAENKCPLATLQAQPLCRPDP